jgi:hypothetical protein
MDPDSDPDPAVFVIDLQDAKTNLNKKFFCLLLFKVTFTSFFKEKSKISRNRVFSYCVCLMIEGSGAGAGSIPLTNGSGSATLPVLKFLFCLELTENIFDNLDSNRCEQVHEDDRNCQPRQDCLNHHAWVEQAHARRGRQV